MKTLMKLNKQLEELESTLFMLEMKDHWTTEDFAHAEILNNSIKELRIKIATIVGM